MSVRSSGGIKDKLETSTIIDLMTVIVLAYDFMLLQDTGQFGGGPSVFSLSANPSIIAAQLTGLLLVTYILEAIVDSSGH
ncbi:MAG: hypothetical protein ABEJ93_03145 [Candidatus Nanohalobium sp.]